MKIIELGFYIIIPIIYLFVCRKVRHVDFGKIDIIIMEIVSVMLSTIVGKFVFGMSTWYELSALIWIIASIICYFFLILKQKNKIEDLYMLLFSGTIGIICYSILTYGQAHIHADVATANLLIQTQLKYHSFFPKSWCYVNGDIWVLGPQIFVYPFYFISDNQTLIRECGACLNVIIVALIMYLYYGKVLKSKAWLIAFPIIFLFMDYNRDMNLYQGAYSCQISLTLLIMLLTTYCFVKKEKNIYVFILYFVFSVLMAMAGPRQIAEVFLPVVIAFCLLFYIENSRKSVSIIIGAIIMSVPVGVGFIIYNLLLNRLTVVMTDTGSAVFVGSISEAWNNVGLTIVDLFLNFGYKPAVPLFGLDGLKNLVLITFCVFFVFVFPILMLIKYNEQTTEIKFLSLFALFHNVEMFILAALCGKCVVARYLMTFEYLSILLSALYVEKYWFTIYARKRLFTIAYIFSIFILSISLVSESNGWKNDLESNKMFSQKMIDEGLDKYKGYASYWYAYNTEVYSDMKLTIASIGNPIEGVQLESLMKHTWLVDSNRYKEEKCGSYLLLSQSEKETLLKTPEEMFGKPEKELNIDGMTIYIWNYDIVRNNFNTEVAVE